MPWWEPFKGANGYLDFIVPTPMAFKRRYARRRRAPLRSYRRRGMRSRKVPFRVRKARSRYRYKLQQRRRIGHPVYKGDAKTRYINFKDVSADSTYPLATRRLYGMDATAIPISGTSTSDGDRTRTIINLRGIKLDFTIANIQSELLVLNVAVLSFKNDIFTLNSATYPAEPYVEIEMMADGFFRSYGGSRDVNFTTGLNGTKICYSAISTDQYNVHAHFRYTLGTSNDSIGQNSNTVSSNMRHIKRYIKINRQVRYNDDAAANCETPIHVVWWLDNPTKTAGAAAILSSCEMNNRSVVFFKELYN